MTDMMRNGVHASATAPRVSGFSGAARAAARAGHISRVLRREVPNWAAKRRAEPAQPNGTGLGGGAEARQTRSMTMYIGMNRESNGSWWPAMVLSVGASRLVTPLR